jgi:hypothetical protein
MMGGVSPKHVEQLRNIGIINAIIWLRLVESFYEFYITMHGSMNIKSINTNFVKDFATFYHRLGIP